MWWILSRSSLGFQFRAVGENPNAARVAGINVKNMYLFGMLISGALVGLAGVNQVLGTITSGFTIDIDAGIGFDAITVALLGRSTPWGTFAAGILFGAFKAGGFGMQAAEQIPIEIVTVVQSLIVLFIAAPPLVRTIFFLPSPERDRRRQEKAREKALKARVEAESGASRGQQVSMPRVSTAGLMPGGVRDRRSRRHPQLEGADRARASSPRFSGCSWSSRRVAA